MVVILPKSMFIPKNEDIIVGIDKTIVAAAKNFIAMFKLFLMVGSLYVFLSKEYS